MSESTSLQGAHRLRASNEITIPWAKPQFWGREESYVAQAMQSSWISGGPFVDRLEREFANSVGADFALATSNGTTAIHLAYLALDIRPGDEIIVPGYSFMAAANIALHVGAVPVFADVDSRTWCLRAKDVEPHLSTKTKVIVPVHTYGNVCALDELIELAHTHRVAVIEDAAEAFASRYQSSFAGTLGDLGTYSLHATKTITTGEGGMVVGRDEALKKKMQLYRSHGMGPRGRYWHEVAGHNFRLTNLQAALGCGQLEQLEQIIEQRRRMVATYQRHLEQIDGVTLQLFPASVEPVVWVVAVKLEPRAFPQGRDAIMERMLSLGIETRPGFVTATRMRHLYSSDPTPTADEISDWVIALPSFPGLTDEDIAFICASLKRSRQ